MQTRTIVIAAALALVLVGAAGLYQLTRSSAKAPATTAAGSADPAREPLLQARAAPSAASLTGDPTLRSAGPVPDEHSEAVPVARGAAVATVNGAAITGAQIVAFRADYGESVDMSREMRDFLLQRAIERELTFQAAKARNLELTAQQGEYLKQVRANAAARGETDPAQIAFEETEARAQLLQQNLLAAEGGVGALADDATVDRYLREHADELGPTPTDPQAAQQQRIDVRQQLYAAQAAQYEARLRALIAGLERAARITR